MYLASMEDFLGIFLGVLALAIPIVAILTHHQQKMAQIMRENHYGQGNAAEVQSLREEVGQLRQQMNQFALALDDVRTALPRTEVQERVSERQING